jgi:hypothetical protein
VDIDTYILLNTTESVSSTRAPLMKLKHWLYVNTWYEWRVHGDNTPSKNYMYNLRNNLPQHFPSVPYHPGTLSLSERRGDRWRTLPVQSRHTVWNSAAHPPPSATPALSPRTLATSRTSRVPCFIISLRHFQTVGSSSGVATTTFGTKQSLHR